MAHSPLLQALSLDWRSFICLRLAWSFCFSCLTLSFCSGLVSPRTQAFDASTRVSYSRVNALSRFSGADRDV